MKQATVFGIDGQPLRKRQYSLDLPEFQRQRALQDLARSLSPDTGHTLEWWAAEEDLIALLMWKRKGAR